MLREEDRMSEENGFAHIRSSSGIRFAICIYDVVTPSRVVNRLRR